MPDPGQGSRTTRGPALRTSSPASASTTTTITTTRNQPQQPEQTSSPRQHQPILRLRGAAPRGGPHVRWTEDVVDNEGLGRKKSKVCCIYHRPHAVDESSDSSSSSSSDSDSDDDPNDIDRRGKIAGTRGGHGRRGQGCGGGNGRGRAGKGGKENKKEKRNPSPNAYERMPKKK